MKKTLLAILLAFSALFTACAGTDSSSERSSDFSFEGIDSSSYGEIDGDCAHVDGDKNDVCDLCATSVAVTFDFYALNDLHGKFADTDAQEGVDEMTTYLKQAKATNENTIILSSGDMWQGSPESNTTKGALITEWMNDVGFTSMTMGNHEYDWGNEYIIGNAELANFPFLGINIYDTTSNQRVDYCQPSVTVEKNGVKIGIIGAIGDCLSSISKEVVGDITFKTGNALTSLVKAEAQKLRNEGADFIIYSLHGDYRDGTEYDTGLSNGYVDLVFEGHTHQSYGKKDEYGVYHLQNAGDNGGISHAKVTINYVNDTSTVISAKSLSPSAYTVYADDPIVNELLQKYDEQISVANRVLGQNEVYRSGNDILTVCAQLYYEAGVRRWGEDYNLVLGGGYMNVRSPYNLQIGTVIYGDLMSILPFDNQLVLCSIKGKDLRERFLETTNSKYYVYCGEYGESIRNSVVDTATYYLVTDTYSSTYTYNNLTEIERYDVGVFARDLLADYISRGGFLLNTETATILEAIEIGNALVDNGESDIFYCVTGEIVEIEPKHSNGTHYGNMTIKDENGNTLYIYGTYDTDGNRYGNMQNPPQVGDVVTLKGKIKKYVNATGVVKIEILSAVICAVA